MRRKFHLMVTGPGVGGVTATGADSTGAAGVDGTSVVSMGTPDESVGAGAGVEVSVGAAVWAIARGLSEPASTQVAARVTMRKGFMDVSSFFLG
jgi:hypothetical protein